MQNSTMTKGLMRIFFSGKISAIDCFTRCTFSKIKGWRIKRNVLDLKCFDLKVDEICHSGR